MRWTNFAIAGLVAGIAAGSPAMAGETSDTSRSELTAAAAYGRDIYQGRCSNCHSNKAGETAFAPTLYGLIGRKAGGLEGFPYSEKLQNLDFVWSNESLSAWLRSQSLDSPILRMRHLGVEDPGDLDPLVEYLATLTPQ